MTREEAIKSIERHIKAHHIGEYPHVFIGEALEMAIAALRAKQTPDNLDRSQWEGCHGCKEEVFAKRRQTMRPIDAVAKGGENVASSLQARETIK